MAKINGLEVKSVKTFQGHDQILLYEGKLYLEGKNIGRFKENYIAGPMDIDLLPELDSAKLNDRIVELNQGISDPWKTTVEDLCPWGENLKQHCLELVIMNIINLKKWEREYQKCHKKYGEITFVVGTDGYHEYFACFNGTDKKGCIEMCENKGWQFYRNNQTSYHAFSSIEDFQYFTPVTIHDIYRSDEEIRKLKEIKGYMPRLVKCKNGNFKMRADICKQQERN